MSIDSAFTPRSLTASEYVRGLFEPTDNVAVLVRNRWTGQTVQRITKAETIASPEFQSWLEKSECQRLRHVHGNESNQGRRAQPDQGKY